MLSFLKTSSDLSGIVLLGFISNTTTLNNKLKIIPFMKTSEKKIDYQFIAVPTNLIYLLDSECLKLFTVFIQEESYWKSKNKLEDNYFYKTIPEISDVMNMNEKDVKLLIEALYKANLIKVILQGDKHKANCWAINRDTIKEIEQKTFIEIQKFSTKIKKLKRGSEITYTKQFNKGVQSVQTIEETKTIIAKNITPDRYELEHPPIIGNLTKTIENISSSTKAILEPIQQSKFELDHYNLEGEDDGHDEEDNEEDVEIESLYVEDLEPEINLELIKKFEHYFQSYNNSEYYGTDDCLYHIEEYFNFSELVYIRANINQLKQNAIIPRKRIERIEKELVYLTIIEKQPEKEIVINF